MRSLEVLRILKKGPVPDLVTPECRPDGYYKPKQCHWHACYCVDRYGNKVDPISPSGWGKDRSWDSPSNTEDYLIECPDDATSGHGHGHAVDKPEILVNGICSTQPDLPCCEETQSAYEKITYGAQDIDYPYCRQDGYFEKKQCNTMTAWCYCVDPTREKISRLDWTKDCEAFTEGRGPYVVVCFVFIVVVLAVVLLVVVFVLLFDVVVI